MSFTAGNPVQYLPVIGALGIGMVWGWILGSLSLQVYRRTKFFFLTSVATGILGILIHHYGSPVTLGFFASGIILVFRLYLLWRRTLRRRFNTTHRQEDQP